VNLQVNEGARAGGRWPAVSAASVAEPSVEWENEKTEEGEQAGHDASQRTFDFSNGGAT